MDNEQQVKWFQRLQNYLLIKFKEAILKWPRKTYKGIYMEWSGQGFGLGFSESTELNEYTYYIDGERWIDMEETAITEVYRELEGIPYEEYDEKDDCEYEVEFEREEFPVDEEDCYELEFFLISIAIAKTYLALKEDNRLKDYLSTIEKIKIISSDRVFGYFDVLQNEKQYGTFTYASPEEHVKKSIVDALIEKEEDKELVLVLWNEKESIKTNEFLSLFK